MRMASKKNPEQLLLEKKYEHIPVFYPTKKRFDFLKSLIVTKQNTDPTMDQLLNTMMDVFEKYYDAYKKKIKSK